MHLHVTRLADAKRPVRGLVFDRRIPPAVEVKDVVGAGQVQARSARLERQDEDQWVMGVFLEAFHHLVPFLGRHPAVQELRRATQCLG